MYMHMYACMHMHAHAHTHERNACMRMGARPCRLKQELRLAHEQRSVASSAQARRRVASALSCHSYPDGREIRPLQSAVESVLGGEGRGSVHEPSTHGHSEYSQGVL
jgi:hypothetical protein